MASQEVGNAEPGTASAGGPPARQAEPEVVNSVYQRNDELQNHQKEKLQALGAVQILNGATVLVLGIFLASLQNIFHPFSQFFFISYTAYPLWGPIFFIVSGSLSVAAGRKPTRTLVQNAFGMCIASSAVALGLMSLMLILTLLELCISTSVSVMWCIESSCNSIEVISFPSNSV
ncbi:membrane-spanning 4-domains subfamily A member 3-like isoform X3 [Ursus americanus]|uniref:membrane-spanning 4-domains subfamily A member 3-like isoform X3 n=1 Tax=Ursus americanus TaxID=9643 RepID=UPI001E67BD43|nr:membrane-spanning 4-domains subfamily A member 3-like isoform X3 [Ursus americanus]